MKKQIEFVLMALVFLSSCFFTKASLALDKLDKDQKANKAREVNPRQYAKEVAYATSRLLKQSKSMGKFLDSLEPYYSVGEVRKTKKLLLAKGISQKDRLPHFKLKGSKIIFDSNNYIDFISPSLLIVNNLKLRKSDLKLHDQVEFIISSLEAKSSKKAFFHDLLFPKAHALGTLAGIAATLAAGALGYFVGPKLGVNKYLGGFLGVGGVYLASELFQNYKDGEVSCTSSGRYQVRSKKRNTAFLATSKQDTVSQNTVDEFGLPRICTADNAKKLEKYLSKKHEIGDRTINNSIE